jgi:tetratricopeptide (TPR) repeat protein
MNPEALKIQQQIMENSKSINDYVKDLYDWEKDVVKKDNIIKNQTQNIKKDPKPKIIQVEKSILENQNTNHHDDQSSSTNKKLKRDINSIGDYYKEWDKIKVEEELRDVDSGIVMNSDSSTNQSIMKSELSKMKVSAANPNLNITIKNNRLGTSGSYAEEHIEKMKNEANAHFAIGNYNKSIEMNMSVIKFIYEEEKKNSESDSRIKLKNFKISIFNNKGNAHLKLANFKEALKDFESVLELDENNIKALFRKGLCLYNLRKFQMALKDFYKAYELSPESEKKTIEEFVNNTLSEINSCINNERKKMENFEISENLKMRNLKVQEVNCEELKKVDGNNSKVSLKTYLSRDKENYNLSNLSNGNEKLSQKDENGQTPKESKSSRPQLRTSLPTIKSEEMVKFVYDITTENLSASSFKYAFRNFKNNEKEKQDYLLKINPAYMPKIFVNDLDKDILNELFTCMKGILLRDQKMYKLNFNEI